MPHYSSRTRNTKNAHNKTQLKTQVNTSDTALHIALKNNNYKIAMELIEHGADVNIKNHDSYTALDIVLRQSSKEAINIAVKLIEHGADVNIKNHNGDTALHIVSQHRDQYADNIAIKLIQHGADANIKNHKGETALHIVSQRHDIYASKMAVTLMEHGADVNIKNNNCEIKEILEHKEHVTYYIIEQTDVALAGENQDSVCTIFDQ